MEAVTEKKEYLIFIEDAYGQKDYVRELGWILPSFTKSRELAARFDYKTAVKKILFGFMSMEEA